MQRSHEEFVLPFIITSSLTEVNEITSVKPEYVKPETISQCLTQYLLKSTISVEFSRSEIGGFYVLD